ncbi:MAG TPA: hypothetical protein P5234_13640 [Thermoanaerobaculaceae bacterium]|nr:hypothetical protein [Thermoanaerobaculaceae bacterium]
MRQDQRFPDLHEADEGNEPGPVGQGPAPSPAPRFSEIFAPEPEKGARGTAVAPPPAVIVDEDNPFGPAGEHPRRPAKGRDPNASFQELVAEIFPPEQPPAPELPAAPASRSALRWVAVAVALAALAAGAVVFRSHIGRLFGVGAPDVGARFERGETPPALAVDAQPPPPRDEPAAAPAEPTPTPPPLPTPTPLPVDPASLPPATRIRAARWEAAGEGGVVVLQADGGVVPRRIRELRLEDPPRVLVRISGIVGPTEPDTVNVGGPLVSRIRFGHHPELSPPELYVVIDLASAAVRGGPPEPTGDTIRIPVSL